MATFSSVAANANFGSLRLTRSKEIEKKLWKSIRQISVNAMLNKKYPKGCESYINFLQSLNIVGGRVERARMQLNNNIIFNYALTWQDLSKVSNFVFTLVLNR